MSDLFWLTDAQMARFAAFFPKSHGKPRVDDRHVLRGIIFVNHNSLRWRDAPTAYGPHKTLYTRWKRWSDKSAFDCMMAGLAAGHTTQAGVSDKSESAQRKALFSLAQHRLEQGMALRQETTIET